MWHRLVDGLRAIVDLPPKTAPAATFSHPDYGEFVDDGTGSGMHAPVMIDWMGSRVRYYPDAPFGTREKGAVIDEGCFPVLKSLIADQANWHERLKAAILEEVYPTYCDYWHDPEAGPALSKDEMWSHLRLESISTDADGGFGFIFRFEESFPSTHFVDASGSIGDGVLDVALAS